ncbi:right-handed parallel beta-helix repeat-containing protein [Thermopirellula anaerolimosa]
MKHITTIFFYGVLATVAAWLQTDTAKGIESPATSSEGATAAADPQAAYPRIDLRADCGAVGDGVTNDTEAFQKAAQILQETGGGTLVIPPGVYRVGKQQHVPGEFPYYRAAKIFTVKGLKYLRIEGNRAVLRLAPGLRFGSFDKDTGEPFQPSTMPFVDHKYAAHVGFMLHIVECDNVVIQDLELDGNLGELIVGGPYGDTGRQLPACGIFLQNNKNATIERVHSHHHALDGIMIGWYGLKEEDPAAPHTLMDCVFEYNGRQGLSWIGGRGLTARRCKFNHTGRAENNGKPFASAPGAGLDIEAEESICRDGYFEDCEFVNNVGCGMVADSGDGGYSRFVRCLFWGVTNWSTWNAKPGLVFEDCTFHGSIVHAVGSDDPALATRWIRCTFEDKPWQGQGPYGGFLAELNGNLKNVTFECCVFRANHRRSIWCSGKGFRFIDCEFIHRFADLPTGEYQAILRGGEVVGCHFKEEFPGSTDARWPILVDGSRVGREKPTVVDGPHVRWGGTQGPIGVIPPSE